MASVTLKAVNKTFNRGVIAVKDFNLVIEPEEFIVLVGPSGCGKSTTLRMIAGLEEPTSGDIYIADKLVNDTPPKDRNIAMVFQNYALYPHMNVRKNLAFGLMLRKYSKAEIDKRVNKAAEILSLGDLLDRKPKELSGGQRQRVALGRAIVRNAQVFLFDEPLSNLDAKLRVQMRSEISKLHNQMKYTMIYVTHDQTEAMTMGSRIVVMKDGLIQQVDTPMTLYKQPVNQFVAGFIGSPGMNFFNIKVELNDTLNLTSVANSNNKIDLANDDLNDKLEPYVGQTVICGIRPEDLLIANGSDNTETGFSARVEVVEPMGNESFIHLDAGLETPLLLRTNNQDLPAIGESIILSMNQQNLHFFHSSTELNLLA